MRRTVVKEPRVLNRKWDTTGKDTTGERSSEEGKNWAGRGKKTLFVYVCVCGGGGGRGDRGEGVESTKKN